jgi:hypothetical protein
MWPKLRLDPQPSMAGSFFVAGDCERITRPVMPMMIGHFSSANKPVLGTAQLHLTGYYF